MSSWSSSEYRLIGDKIEHFHKCERRLTVQTTTTRKNPGKRFISCSVCGVYDFLDDDLPSEYYKDLLCEMYQKKKRLKKHVDYEQLIDVLAMNKSKLEEELRAAKSKMKLYDSFDLHGMLTELIMMFIVKFGMQMYAHVHG
ncbi:hypothetical protein Tco_0295585 [Tanacetum coccineum]